MGAVPQALLAGALVPVQSTIIHRQASSAISGTTGRISALPALSTADPAAPVLQAARDLMSAGRYAEALQQIDAALQTQPGQH